MIFKHLLQISTVFYDCVTTTWQLHEIQRVRSLVWKWQNLYLNKTTPQKHRKCIIWRGYYEVQTCADRLHGVACDTTPWRLHQASRVWFLVLNIKGECKNKTKPQQSRKCTIGLGKYAISTCADWLHGVDCETTPWQLHDIERVKSLV